MNNVKRRICTASDIALSDIVVTNRRCKGKFQQAIKCSSRSNRPLYGSNCLFMPDEAESADVLESEQSVGMTLDVQKDRSGANVLTVIIYNTKKL